MPKTLKTVTSPFMLFRANMVDRVRAQEVLSESNDSEGFKAIWARAKEQWGGMSDDEKDKWGKKHEELKAALDAREAQAKERKEQRGAKKAKKAEIYKQFQMELAAETERLYVKYVAALVAEGLANPESLPDDAEVSADA